MIINYTGGVMRKKIGILLAGIIISSCQQTTKETKVEPEKPKISKATQQCINCHKVVTPGIVAEWEKSKHAKITVAQALKKSPDKRLISASTVPPELENVVVGCAECHTQNPQAHKDTFDHNGFKVHIVVTPKDCATCHPVEADQFSQSLKANAYANLMKNPVYHTLASTTVAPVSYHKGKVKLEKPTDKDFATSCLKCHGTVVKVKGYEEKETPFGKMKFPVLEGWPNHGVGRINPDGSKGSCSACHTRHSFSMEIARKPETCGECHKGPDVPAYKVYMTSKHGSIYKSIGNRWNYENPEWVAGKDFTAPTCASCHISQIVDENGNVIAKRTHKLIDRLPYRLLGIYAVPHIKYSKTYTIKNSMGLPLPYELDGTPVKSAVIDSNEVAKRLNTMKKVCSACHAQTLIDNHFKEMDDMIAYSNKQILQATGLLVDVWKKNLEKGIPQGKNPFDEPIERLWTQSWLFYGTSIRYGAAMGSADYTTFANGKWQLGKTIKEMEMLKNLKEKTK